MGARALNAEIAAVRRRIMIALHAANLLGASLGIVFLALIVPYPVGFVDAPEGLVTRNLIVAGIYTVLGTIYATLWDRRWFSRLPSDEALRGPRALLIPCAQIWCVGALIFAAINLSYSWRLAFSAATAVALGGMTTAALSYLFAERLLRPLTADALQRRAPQRPARARPPAALSFFWAGGPLRPPPADALERRAPERPAGLGVATRLLLTWALVAGLPLLGLAELALHVLVDTPMSTSRLAASVLFIAVSAIATGVVATVLLARSLADPLLEMRKAVSRVRTGGLDASVGVYDGSEIGLLQAGFNEMAGGLREREELRDLFGRHVGRDVAERALDAGIELGGEVREVAVLFIDLTDSTSLALDHSPAQLVTLLNRFFAVVVELVADNDGWVNKFEGDAALCIFGAPLPLEDACGCALKTAREMAPRLAERVPELDAGIGVSAGRVVAGNVGAPDRFEYTVIGDPVNEAARLSEEAKRLPDRTLVSASTVDHADDGEASRWRRHGDVPLRGRPDPTAVLAPERAFSAAHG